MSCAAGNHGSDIDFAANRLGDIRAGAPIRPSLLPTSDVSVLFLADVHSLLSSRCSVTRNVVVRCPVGAQNFLIVPVRSWSSPTVQKRLAMIRQQQAAEKGDGHQPQFAAAAAAATGWVVSAAKISAS